jgi:hypothetical protein
MNLTVNSALATHGLVWYAREYTAAGSRVQAYCPECDWSGPDRTGDAHALQLGELDAISHLHMVAAERGIYTGMICRADRCADCTPVESLYWQHSRDRLRNNGHCYACGRDLRLPYKGTCGHCDPCPENLDGIA